MMVQQLFFWCHCLSLIINTSTFNFRKVFSNINILAIIVGFLFFILQIKLPTELGRAVSSIASMIGPMSMIMLGMIFAGSSWKELLGYKR